MVCANFILLSTVQPATCGESSTLFALIKYSKASGTLFLEKRCSKEVFSYSKTSKAAPNIFPDFKAATKSVVITADPRAVFMSQKFFLNPFIKAVFIN